MLARYDLESIQDYKNAIKEITQEIALLGLWRSKFFEIAAFYGGTALRILHKLDRFSEDLDFTLIRPSSKFDISKYEKAVQVELESFGFEASVNKKHNTAVDSVFTKLNTIQHLIHIGLPNQLAKTVQHNDAIKIRLEVDKNPPNDHAVYETKFLLQPIPFSVKTLRLEDLFAGKAHATLCREWKGRVKGRDWYDLLWFIAKDVKLNLFYLQQRMIQSGHLKGRHTLLFSEVTELFLKKIDQLNISDVKRDIAPFLSDTSSIEVWSKEFLKDCILRIKPLAD